MWTLNSIFNLGGNLSNIGNWADIIGIFLTIGIFIFTDNLRRKFNRLINFKNLKTEKKSLRNDLASTKDLIIENPTDLQNTYELSKIIRRLEEYYDHLTRSDKAALKIVKKIVKNGITEDNLLELVNNIGTLLGFLEGKKEYDINGI